MATNFQTTAKIIQKISTSILVHKIQVSQAHKINQPQSNIFYTNNSKMNCLFLFSDLF